MLDEEIQCMNCSKNIINQKNTNFILYTTPLTKEETISSLNNIIETQNLPDIKTGVCVSCLYEYLNSIKDRLKNEEEKHEDCIKALKDLLLDLSYQKEIKNIIESSLVENEIKEIKEQDKKYRTLNLNTKRKALEEKIKEQKNEYKKLKEEESDILFKLNKNERIQEEKIKYKEKLIIKKQYLQKYYEKIIKQD